jgi:hypothetical protein
MTRKITVTSTGYDPALGRAVRDPTLEGDAPNPAERAATARMEAVVPENSAHLEVWLGRRCVLATEVDDELPFDRRVAIANRLAVLINQGRRP